MSNILIEQNDLKDIANSIRRKIYSSERLNFDTTPEGQNAPLIVENNVVKGNTYLQPFLPLDYTQVKYITYSHGLLNFNYTPEQGDEFVIKNVSTNNLSSSGGNILDTSGGQSDNTIYLSYDSKGTSFTYKYFSNTAVTFTVDEALVNAEIKIDSNGNLYIDGELKATSPYVGSVSGYIQSGRYGLRVGSIYITNNGVEKAFLIPCKKSIGVSTRILRYNKK